MEDFWTKPYLHFDYRRKYSSVRSRVENPMWVSRHGFFPLILKVQKNRRYNNIKKEFIDKKRKIYRASHIDSCIYKYYSQKLAEFYEKKVEELEISNVVAAYRNTLCKSNIDFAAEVINFIFQKNQAFILLIDFEKFFDTLNHKILKESLIKCLGTKGLNNDWFKVYKNLTHFSYYSQSDLNKVFGTEKDQYNANMKCYFDSFNQFRKFKNSNPPCKDQLELKEGIAQGTPISAVMSNVYMIEFDKAIKNLIEEYDGKYLRYADDIIIVVPGERVDCTCFSFIEKKILNFAREIMKLKVNESKTKRFIFADKKIRSLEGLNDTLDYLGFIFDGLNVKMRQKSVSRFYYRAYKAIIASQIRTRKKFSVNLIGKKHIYRYYFDRGAYDKKASKFGNFISYAKRSQTKFDELSPYTNNLMMQQIQNREKKILKKMRTPGC